MVSGSESDLRLSKWNRMISSARRLAAAPPCVANGSRTSIADRLVRRALRRHQLSRQSQELPSGGLPFVGSRGERDDSKGRMGAMRPGELQGSLCDIGRSVPTSAAIGCEIASPRCGL